MMGEDKVWRCALCGGSHPSSACPDRSKPPKPCPVCGSEESWCEDFATAERLACRNARGRRISDMYANIQQSHEGIAPEPPAVLTENPPSEDNVHLPKHYSKWKIEPIRFIMENNLSFEQGNVIKYVMRWEDKNGIEDWEKAKRYCEMKIKQLKGDPDWWKWMPYVTE